MFHLFSAIAVYDLSLRLISIFSCWWEFCFTSCKTTDSYQAWTDSYKTPFLAQTTLLCSFYLVSSLLTNFDLIHTKKSQWILLLVWECIILKAQQLLRSCYRKHYWKLAWLDFIIFHFVFWCHGQQERFKLHLNAVNHRIIEELGLEGALKII